MQPLKQRWSVFASVALDPWAVLMATSVLALFASSLYASSKITTSLLFVMITAASAVLGGRITKQWADLNEAGVVRARGRSAVRSLMLLLRRTTSLESRTQRFLKDVAGDDATMSLTARNYEEIVEACRLIADETVSSIENWTDIVPEANIGTQIGLIAELRGSLAKRESELQELQEEMELAKGQSKQDTGALQDLITEKEQQVRRLEQEIWQRKKETGIASLVRSGEFSEATTSNPFLEAAKAGIIGASMPLGDSLAVSALAKRGLRRRTESES
jgi:hypothetical protein